MKRSRTLAVLGVLVLASITGAVLFNTQTIAAFVADVTGRVHPAENVPANAPSSDTAAASSPPDTGEETAESAPEAADGPATYSVEEIEGGPDEDGNTKRLIANVDGEDIEGLKAPFMEIEKEADFNGDGVMDALVSTSQGGNCCPDAHIIVSVEKGEVVASELDYDWGQYSVVEENGRMLVKHETDDATTYYGYGKDFEVAVVKTIKHRVLKAEKEIHGEGNLYTGSDTERTLKADLNNDGKKEEITCTLWSRWGSLTNCGLPLPDGSIQEWAQDNCHRFGVLSSSRNGYRELVCDNNTVIYFDGKKWTEDDK